MCDKQLLEEIEKCMTDLWLGLVNASDYILNPDLMNEVGLSQYPHPRSVIEHILTKRSTENFERVLGKVVEAMKEES